MLRHHRNSLLALVFCMPLIGSCTDKPSAPIAVTILRDGVLDKGALTAVGHAAGVPAEQDIACALSAGEGIKSPDCHFTLRNGGLIWGPYITLPHGHYRLVYHFDVTPTCPGGHVRFDVTSQESGFTALGRWEETIEQSRDVSAGFDVADHGGDLGKIEFRSFTDGEHPVCVVLTGAKLLAE